MSPADQDTVFVYKTIAFIPSKRGSKVVVAGGEFRNRRV